MRLNLYRYVRLISVLAGLAGTVLVASANQAGKQEGKSAQKGGTAVKKKKAGPDDTPIYVTGGSPVQATSDAFPDLPTSDRNETHLDASCPNQHKVTKIEMAGKSYSISIDKPWIINIDPQRIRVKPNDDQTVVYVDDENGDSKAGFRRSASDDKKKRKHSKEDPRTAVLAIDGTPMVACVLDAGCSITIHFTNSAGTACGR